MSEIGSDCARLRCDSVHPIGYMEEILTNILSKLPVKTVVSCKCVAKHWLRLISEPSFPHLQLTGSRKKLKFVLCPYPEDDDIVTHVNVLDENGKISEEIHLPGLECVCSPEVICFSNGLICSVNEDCSGQCEVDIRIFNPITHDNLVLPRGSQSKVVPSVGIAFDPKTSDFKAFRFFSDAPEGKGVKYKCEVYTSGSTTWRRVSKDVKQRPEHNPFHPGCPYFASVAGVIYWFGWSDGKPGIPARILSVDMNDKFAEVNLPARLRQWSFLIELEGCLSVVHVKNPDLYLLGSHEDPQPYVEVYKLENGGWKLRSKAVIDLTNVHSFNSVAVRDNEILFIIRLEDDSVRYLHFDFVRKTFKNLDVEMNFEYCSPVAFAFAESLLKCSGK